MLAAHGASLRALPGVVGTAVGQRAGSPCIRVFIAAERAGAREEIPEFLEGYPVFVEVTGQISAR